MITTIIPCYNAEPYLAEAIESVLRQSRPVGEVLVVDDCSTDGSVAVARRYPQVTVLSTPSNSGHAAARNVGIAAAQGDLIAWLDADDYWEPDHCEVVCGLLESHVAAAVAYSRVRLVGRRSGVWGTDYGCGLAFDAFHLCFRETIVPAISAVTRTDAVREVGGFDVNIRVAPDFDFWLRMAERFPFVATEQITSNYRWHSSQISRYPIAQVRSLCQARGRWIESARARGDESTTRALEQLQLDAWDRALLQHGWLPGNRRAARDLLEIRSLMPRDTRTSRRLERLALLPAPIMRLAARFVRLYWRLKGP